MRGHACQSILFNRNYITVKVLKLFRPPARARMLVSPHREYAYEYGN